MWKFKYLRADREEVEMGPYATKFKAEAARNKMASLGALCSEPFEVSGEAQNINHNYVDEKVADFENFFSNETRILNQRGITFEFSYDFLNTAIKRMKLFIWQAAPFVPSREDFYEEMVQSCAEQRREYLSRVADIVERHSHFYGPLDGSAKESIGEYLAKLSEEVKNDKIVLAQTFVVVALHDTGHGKSESVVQVCQDPLEAMITARDAEKLGYEFYSIGTGVTIFRVEMSKRYHKDEFKFPGIDKLPPDYPVIFSRRKAGSNLWENEFFDKDMVAFLKCAL